MMLAQPVMDAPALNFVENDTSWFPYLFITIACGAVSGFHALVSTGTTSKQLYTLKDARPIGYGSMLGEASLAIAATIAVAAGFESADQWHHHYSSFAGAQGLGSKLSAFVQGTSSFVQPITDYLGFTHESSASLNAVFISVLVISFAATSLDTAVRIQRYVLSEIGQSLRFTKSDNRYLYTGLAVLFSFLLVLLDSSGSGGLILWPLFGSTNQLLGALTLMVITIWLYMKRRNFWVTLIPLSILLVIVSLASVFNLTMYYRDGNYLLLVMAGLIIVCHTWLLVEGLKFVRNVNNPDR
jgi:carbon starvation protein